MTKEAEDYLRRSKERDRCPIGPRAALPVLALSICSMLIGPSLLYIFTSDNKPDSDSPVAGELANKLPPEFQSLNNISWNAQTVSQLNSAQLQNVIKLAQVRNIQSSLDEEYERIRFDFELFRSEHEHIPLMQIIHDEILNYEDNVVHAMYLYYRLRLEYMRGNSCEGYVSTIAIPGLEMTDLNPNQELIIQEMYSDFVGIDNINLHDQTNLQLWEYREIIFSIIRDPSNLNSEEFYQFRSCARWIVENSKDYDHLQFRNIFDRATASRFQADQSALLFGSHPGFIKLTRNGSSAIMTLIFPYLDIVDRQLEFEMLANNLSLLQ